MFYKIDYISFTVRFTAGQGRDERECLQLGLTALEGIWEDCYNALNMTHDWKWANGRRHYTACYRSPDNGTSIWVNPRVDHILIEMTGRACTTLERYEHANAFLDAIKSRLTRLDVAADMLTDTTPTDFLAERETGRFKAHAFKTSASGTTHYIGSETSSRFMKCYRYNPPHERAHLLRVEFTLRDENAENTARSLLSDGISAVTKALGTAFGLKHDDWQPDAVDEAILEVWRPERGQGKTVFWLNDTIAPLLLKLHHAGTIDIYEWFQTNIQPKL